MNTFAAWAFREVYIKQKSDNRLLQIVDIIDWKPIRDVLEEMYRNKSEKGGRPNCDVLMMFRILILEEWYGLSDLEVVRQISDRVSFMGFLGFPERVPDSSTVWLFKERMIETGTYDRVWDEFRDQLDSKGLKVKSGTIQDATAL